MSVVFEAGAVFSNEICQYIIIIDDYVLEDDEVFIVTLTSNEPAFNLTQATVTIYSDPADCKDCINFWCQHCVHDFVLHPPAVVELGFQQSNYTVSEQELLSEAFICVIINRGILEKEVAVNLTIMDESAEGT